MAAASGPWAQGQRLAASQATEQCRAPPGAQAFPQVAPQGSLAVGAAAAAAAEAFEGALHLRAWLIT